MDGRVRRVGAQGGEFRSRDASGFAPRGVGLLTSGTLRIVPVEIRCFTGVVKIACKGVAVEGRGAE